MDIWASPQQGQVMCLEPDLSQHKAACGMDGELKWHAMVMVSSLQVTKVEGTFVFIAGYTS